MFTGAAIIAWCITGKSQNSDYACLYVALISKDTASLLYSLPIYGLDPGLSTIEVTLSLYEREEGPMPSRLGWTIDSY